MSLAWRRGRRRGGRGFTYPGVLFIVALLGLLAAAAAPVWRVLAQQEREQQLLFAGQQLRDAIERYHRMPLPGAEGGTYPRTLQQLLADDRGGTTRRHLRRPYADPFSTAPWGLLRTPDGAIIGVFSTHRGAPLKRQGFPPGLAFEQARSLRDWRFVAPSAAALAGSALAEVADEPPAPEDPGAGAPETAPEPEQALPPVEPRPPRPSDFTRRDAAACARIEAYDRVLCRQQDLQFGPQAAAECTSSAAQRAAVCPFADAFALPPLYLRTP